LNKQVDSALLEALSAGQRQAILRNEGINRMVDYSSTTLNDTLAKMPVQTGS